MSTRRTGAGRNVPPRKSLRISSRNGITPLCRTFLTVTRSMPTVRAPRFRCTRAKAMPRCSLLRVCSARCTFWSQSLLLGCHIHGLLQRPQRCTHLLPPFAMCTALPCSDYYEGSAPRPRHRRAWRLAGCFGPGARLEVLTFPKETLGAVGVQLCPWQLWPSVASEQDGRRAGYADAPDLDLEAAARRRGLAVVRPELGEPAHLTGVGVAIRSEMECRRDKCANKQARLRHTRRLTP